MKQPKYFPSNNWEKMVKPKPHTNEHWFCLLPTEEKADKLTDFSFWLVPTIPTEDKREQIRKRIEEWLKQPHTTPQKQDDYPCNVKGCSLETRQACCGCPDYFEWEKQNR